MENDRTTSAKTAVTDVQGVTTVIPTMESSTF